MADAAAHAHDDHHPGFFTRWFLSTNHKDIGTMYLVFSLVMFFIGGAMAMIIRLELFQPGLQFVDPQFFNSMTTMHALIMIFGVVMPAWTGLANWLVPMMIGAPAASVSPFMSTKYSLASTIASRTSGGIREPPIVVMCSCAPI